MNTVTFGSKDSYDDFDLVLTSKSIESPKAKTNAVDVPGMDGVVDLTEYFGEVNYSNRKLSFEFSTVEPVDDFASIYSTLQNEVNGRRMQIRLSDDPGYYYVGRVQLNDWKTDKAVGKIAVDVDCEPYKYKDEITQKADNVSGSKTVTYQNLQKSVVPTFVLGAAMSITFGSHTYQVTAGTYVNNEIRFVAGNNQVSYSGSGMVTVKYQERGF